MDDVIPDANLVVVRSLRNTITLVFRTIPLRWVIAVYPARRSPQKFDHPFVCCILLAILLSPRVSDKPDARFSPLFPHDRQTRYCSGLDRMRSNPTDRKPLSTRIRHDLRPRIVIVWSVNINVRLHRKRGICGFHLREYNPHHRRVGIRPGGAADRRRRTARTGG